MKKKVYIKDIAQKTAEVNGRGVRKRVIANVLKQMFGIQKDENGWFALISENMQILTIQEPSSIHRLIFECAGVEYVHIQLKEEKETENVVESNGFSLFKAAYILSEFSLKGNDKPLKDFVSMLVTIAQEWKYEYDSRDALPLLNTLRGEIGAMIYKIEKSILEEGATIASVLNVGAEKGSK